MQTSRGKLLQLTHAGKSLSLSVRARHNWSLRLGGLPCRLAEGVGLSLGVGTSAVLRRLCVSQGCSSPQLPSPRDMCAARERSMGFEAASPSAPAASRARCTSEALSSLPLDVLEKVCCLLELRDRIALTSCCRPLWERPDVMASRALWGDLSLSRFQFRFVPHLESFAAWLKRRGVALRKLQLQFWRSTMDPTPMLASLAGSGLESLLLVRALGVGLDAEGTLCLLRGLPALSCLEINGCGLQSVPEQLVALPALRQLRLGGNASLGDWGDAAWAPLAQLTALTRLKLYMGGLRRMPPQLSFLVGLQDLSLASNCLGRGGADSFRPLTALRGLTRLNLADCGLAAVPPEAGALPVLAVLELGHNESMGPAASGRVPPWAAWAVAQPADVFRPLAACHALTRLSLSECGLRCVPQELAALTALRELNLCHNTGLGEAGEWAFEPLHGLASLTCLVLGRCGLTRLPPALFALPALQVLVAWDNPALGTAGPDEVLAPLLRLPDLRRVDVSRGRLQREGCEAQIEALEAAGVVVEV